MIDIFRGKFEYISKHIIKLAKQLFKITAGPLITYELVGSVK